MPKIVITGPNGATTSTNAAVTDPNGAFVQSVATSAHPKAGGAVIR